MRARDRDLPDGAGADHGIERGVVGIGDPLDGPPPEAIEEAVLRATEQHGERAGRLLSAFAGVEDGSFVWTRDGGGAYALGRIDGPWRCDGSAAARRVGIVHVRPATWLQRRFGDGEVPAAVAATFARGGRNFQRTHDAQAEARTAELWDAGAP